MKRTSILSAALISMMMMTGCGSSKSVLDTVALNGDWNITTVNGELASGDKQPFLSLNVQEKQVYGCAGCNRISGDIELNEQGNISFGQIGSTRMLCPNMGTERAILLALNDVKKYTGTETELELTNEDGKVLLTLVKRPDLCIGSLAGKWKISKVNGEAIETLGTTETAPFLEFDAQKNTIHGNAGCNIVNGEVVIGTDEKGSIKFQQMITTMMSGPGMEVETKVMEAIQHVSSFIMPDAHHVIMTDANGQEVLTLTKE